MKISMEELAMVRDCIILGMMIEMTDHSRKKTETSTNILKSLFIDLTDHMNDLIIADHIALKKQLKAAEIKFEEAPEATDFLVHYDIWCRGYYRRFSMTRDVVKTQLSIKFGEYHARLSDTLNGRP